MKNYNHRALMLYKRWNENIFGKLNVSVFGLGNNLQILVYRTKQIK